ncbi:Hypothetical Protein sle_40850 [Streptomyces leeuwenhoekii]|uniref:Uncharacterized protein n=1 Tax=Streptomyces leeuwenhoekii TaxID=1437453 RepID=A0A0F7VSR9_STRLW|nr:Hypothetical Protein sle_40850 [Streptomyces leeuwenhoekii]
MNGRVRGGAGRGEDRGREGPVTRERAGPGTVVPRPARSRVTSRGLTPPAVSLAPGQSAGTGSLSCSVRSCSPAAASRCCAGRFGSANISRKIAPITAATQPSACRKPST